MSRYGDAPSTTTDSSIGGAGGGGGRWDAERFMREREERHEPSRRQRRTTVSVAERERVEKKKPSFVEQYLESQEKYGPPARRPERTYQDDHLVSTSGAVIPYEERRRASPSPPRRPTLLRRQSSLDTFDLAASRRAHDYYRYDSDDYGPPVAPVVVPRRRSPPTEPDLESVRVAEPDYYGDEEFRGLRERDRSATPRGRRYSSLREEVVREKMERTYPRRGKTRIPKHLVHPSALTVLGYPYEDEGDSILILKALAKENIDEVVSLSREVRQRTYLSPDARGGERVVTSRRRSESVSVERRRSVSRRRVAAPTEIVEMRSSRSSRTYSPSRYTSPSPSPSPPIQRPRVRHHQRRLSSPIRIIEPRDDVIQPNSDVALILPERHRRSDRELRAEIRALEAQRQGGLVPKEVVEVRKDVKAPSPRLLRAMMATLT